MLLLTSAIGRVFEVVFGSFGLMQGKDGGNYRSPQTAPLILPTRRVTASDVVPFEPPVEAEGG
ncbi:hypothetical protein A2U01_0114651, partial [Trifolium medium]|nr:hypothetical protein [Trifolium medium]